MTERTARVTVDTLREALAHYRGELATASHLNCRPIAHTLRRRIAEKEAFDISIEIINGTICPDGFRGHGEEHSYLIVEPDNVADSDKPVIFDPSIDQFSEENKADGLVHLAIDSDNAFPPVVVTRGRWNHNYDTKFYYTPATVDNAIALGALS